MQNFFELDSDGEESFINLTPLIDVVFVVLISFILIAPLLKMDKIELAAPGPNAQILSESFLQIAVQKDNSIWIEGKNYSLKELKTYLSNREKKESIQLLYDQDASFGTYQNIKTIAEIEGFKELQILLKN